MVNKTWQPLILNPHTVTILLGDGNGGFIQPAGSPVSVGTTPYSLELGDFNGDSKQDIAVANFSSANVTIISETELLVSVRRLVRRLA